MAGQSQIPEDFNALYDSGARAARGTPLSAPSRTGGHGRLSAEIPGLLVDYDEATGLPNRIAVERPAGRLTSVGAASPEEAAANFVRERGDLWELSPSDAAGVEVVSVSGRGLPTVQLVQRVEGVEVFSSEVTAAIGGDNQVIALAGQFFPGATEAGGQRSAGPVTSAEEAISRAAHDLTGTHYEPAEFTPLEGEDGQYRFYAVPEADSRPAFERPVRVKDVLFPLGDGQLSPGYYLELWIKGFPAFSYVIDSVDDPDVLFRKNLSADSSFKYKVFNTGDAVLRPEDGPAPGTPHPTGRLDGFQARTIPERVIDTEGLLKGDPWLPDGATTTQGNNCFAYADLAAPQGFGDGDVVGKASAPGCFEYTYDHSKAASDPNNLQSSLVGMFVHVNWLHDRWYEAGFDEAAGNAQQDNFGRGGSGGDPILAEGHDFSGTDNANMSTPADGASPRMQMYEFVGVSPLPSRTSNFDALITFHEMGHYVTNRLVGNATGLSNQQGRAMGEGWGDFFAICMTSQATDNFANGTFAVGGWTDLTSSFRDNYYFSIRRYPYTADLGKNPLTFKHISANVVLPSGPLRNPNGGGPNNEVHNAGEVWCATLWEVFVNLVAKHGHAEAERRMLEYVIGGLKLTPSRPTYTQARDGIISAVAALNAADLPEVWQGFAKRGMGTAAVSPPSSSSSLAGVVESFDVP
ncbi:Fungalysin metallopeptidase (M36) [Amycolatopsis xylanica]|uniref:Fungalysin metallopeptidase (M36) n=1 Tax=Amycolatopsis xylanica TaxID=589385 RepID=A0A1H3PB86_9PSEU|nr:M36 family metallopeptidase [Amycolatopsis xylanica]SDY98396.1 Fungalysin metallopeptidase (M36) [Amycolatopsis xylanica]